MWVKEFMQSLIIKTKKIINSSFICNMCQRSGDSLTKRPAEMRVWIKDFLLNYLFITKVVEFIEAIKMRF